jgi:hypothetical protein
MHSRFLKNILYLCAINQKKAMQMSEVLKNQKETKQKGYAEAMRYMANAKETLQKARKEDNHYADKKYVRTSL